MSKADTLGVGGSFTRARPVSARRAATAAAGIPTDVAAPTTLSIDQISHNPDNPRQQLDNLEELAQTIEAVGLINPISIAHRDAYVQVRPDREAELDDNTQYVVVDGHRRLESCRKAGMSQIDVRVNDDLVTTDETLLEAAFIANVHSDQMSDLEQANALKALVDFYGSQTTATKRLGLSQATISSKLSLLKLTPELQADLVNGRRKAEHLRNLGKLTPEQQQETADARAAAQQTASAPPTAAATVTNERKQEPDHHDVIIEPDGTNDESANEPDTDVTEPANPDTQPTNPVPSPPPDTSAEPAAKPASGRPSQTQPSESPEPEFDAYVWQDPEWLADLIRAHMSDQHRRELLRRLAD